MSQANCPVCCEDLETKEVTPCFVCGAWESVDAAMAKKRVFSEYLLDDGRKIVLCQLCYLEDICSDQGDTKTLLGINDDRDVRFQRSIDLNAKAKDKYCNTCKKRLALLELREQQL